MKAFTAIVSVVGLIVVPVAIYLLSREVPEIRYTLSDPIRVRGEGETTRIWQQIEVRNGGTIAAEKVQVKVSGEVTDHELTKNSEADEPEVFSKSNGFEVIYPSLPPGGVFVLTLATSADTITLGDISVAHSRGVGVEAFSRVGKPIALFVAMSLLGLGIVFFYGYLFLSLAVDRIDYAACYSDPKGVLGREKPWYVSQGRWATLRETATKHLLPSWRHKGDFSANEAYQFLQGDTPTFLTESEWYEARIRAVRALEEDLAGAIVASYSADRLLPLLRLERPTHMDQNDWTDLRRKAHTELFRLRRSAFCETPESCVSALREHMPPGVDPIPWGQHVARVRSVYCDYIIHELNFAQNPLKALDQHDVSVLTEDQRDRLREVAYRRQLLLLPDLLESEEAQRFLDQERPAWLMESDYQKRVKLATRITEITTREIESSKREKEQRQREEQLTAKEQNTSKAATHVAAQLRILNDILSDPNAIDRIESHDNPFATGNFANLQRIASLLRQTMS